MGVDFQSRNYRLPMLAIRNLKLETRSWEGTKPSHPFSSILSYQLQQKDGLIAVPSFSMVSSIAGYWLGSHDAYVLWIFSVTRALDPIKKQDGLKIIHFWPKSLHCYEKRFLRKIAQHLHIPRPLVPPFQCCWRGFIRTTMWFRVDETLIQGGEEGGEDFLGTTEYFLIIFVHGYS